MTFLKFLEKGSEEFKVTEVAMVLCQMRISQYICQHVLMHVEQQVSYQGTITTIKLATA